MQRSEERLNNARAQRNRLLAAFEGIHAAEDDMEAVIARCTTIPTCLTHIQISHHHYRASETYML